MIHTYEKALSFLTEPQRVSALAMHDGKDKTETVTEIRLRKDAPLSLTVTTKMGEENRVAEPREPTTEEGLRAILSRICHGSFHTYEEEILRGWFSPRDSGGIRVGVAGEVLCEGEGVTVLRGVQSLCLRLPNRTPQRDEIPLGILRGNALPSQVNMEGTKEKPLLSTLFYAPPGVGKTTLLRNLIRTVSEGEGARRAAVIDTSAEIHTSGFAHCIADFFIGYPKDMGISLAVRAFSPEIVFCDELGSPKEAEALLRAQIGGVPIVATAHADTLSELLCRPTFSTLYKNRVFDRYIRLFRTCDTFSYVEESAGDSA